MEGRHFEDQLPFIGFIAVSNTIDNLAVLRLDLRYNLFGKHYLTAAYNTPVYPGCLISSGKLSEVIPLAEQGVDLKYSYSSLLGPISLTTHWFNSFGQNHFGAYFSFGYTF